MQGQGTPGCHQPALCTVLLTHPGEAAIAVSKTASDGGWRHNTPAHLLSHQKALWVSASADLYADAKRDLRAVCTAVAGTPLPFGPLALLRRELWMVRVSGLKVHPSVSAWANSRRFLSMYVN